MAENGGYLPNGTRVTYVDPTPPLVPENVGPGPSDQDRHAPLDMALLDEVDEGVQRLNVVVPLTPKSRRLKELEDMVKETSARHRADVLEAQEMIDRANEETRAMRRERDGARSNAAPQQAPLSALPVPFEFGGFRTALPNDIPARAPPPRHPTPISSPPVGFGTVRPSGGEGGSRDLQDTVFLSAKGSLLSHIELSREVRMSREAKEEAKRGTALKEQTTFLQVQAQLDEYFGVRGVPEGIQQAVDQGEKQLTESRGVCASRKVTVQPSPPSSEGILYYRAKSKSAFAR